MLCGNDIEIIFHCSILSTRKLLLWLENVTDSSLKTRATLNSAGL